MPASPIALKNSLPEPALNPGRREYSARQASRHFGLFNSGLAHWATETGRVQGHKVKYSNRNNSAADCSILFKFGTAFDCGDASLLHMFKVKGQGHGVRVQGHSVM